MPSTKNRSCLNKTPYLSKVKASDGLRYYQTKYGVATGTMEVYKCKYCHNFHFGHKKRRKANS